MKEEEKNGRKKIEDEESTNKFDSPPNCRNFPSPRSSCFLLSINWRYLMPSLMGRLITTEWLLNDDALLIAS